MIHHMENYIQGKVVIVTGSGSGFGRLTCQKIARMGGFPVVSDINEAAIKETIALIESEGGKAIGRICDVRELSVYDQLLGGASCG